MMTRLYLFIFSILLAITTQAQITTESSDDEYSGMEAGLNVGVYLGNRNTANFYNGAGQQEDEMNSADNILYNIHYVNQINEVLEQNGFPYLLHEGEYYMEYPTNMVYSPSIYAGLTGRYWLNRKFGISLSMNVSRLTTRDNFLIHVPNEIPTNKEPLYIIGTIAGQEDRVNIDFGIINKFPISDKMNFIMEYGFNFNNTSVQFNKIEIYGLVLDIMYKGPNDYVPGGNQQLYSTFTQGGLGYGGYLTPGLQFNFNENISVDLVSQFYYTHISLEHYSNWGFQWVPYVRFNFTRLFF